MALLSIVVNSVADGFWNAYINRGDFSFLISIKNNSAYVSYDDLAFVYTLETQSNGNNGLNAD